MNQDHIEDHIEANETIDEDKIDETQQTCDTCDTCDFCGSTNIESGYADGWSNMKLCVGCKDCGALLYWG